MANSGIDALDHRYRFFAAVGDTHFDERICQAHRAKAGAARTELSLTVLLNEVLVGVDHVVQEAHGYFASLGESLPIHFAVFYKGGEIQGSEVANAPRRKTLLSAIQRAVPISDPGHRFRFGKVIDFSSPLTILTLAHRHF